jgi:hypothetical protein
MARESITQGEVLDRWQLLTQTLAGNTENAQHLEPPRAQLEAMLVQAQGLRAQQKALTASKQEISRQLQTLILDGQKLANLLRVGVKQRFGNRSEKLVEFGIQPFRGRKRAKQEEPAEPKPPVEQPAQ